MRLRRIDLLAYGHFTNSSFELLESRPDLHVIFGLNEAGKSTVLSAIEDLLFGISRASTLNFLHDYSSMRLGAVFEKEKQLLEVRRRKGNKDTLLNGEDLPVPTGEAALAPFLCGADRPFFERMFCLDHERLRRGGRDILEAQDDVGQILFSAGTGLVGLRERLQRMQAEADALWASRRASHRAYYKAEDKLKDAEGALESTSSRPNSGAICVPNSKQLSLRTGLSKQNSILRP